LYQSHIAFTQVRGFNLHVGEIAQDNHDLSTLSKFTRLYFNFDYSGIEWSQKESLCKTRFSSFKFLPCLLCFRLRLLTPLRRSITPWDPIVQFKFGGFKASSADLTESSRSGE